MKQIERIQYYEQLFDELTNNAKQMEKALELYKTSQEKLQELEHYYTSKDWKKDYEADEANQLPKDLKRGVLSQDGINDLLDQFIEFKHRLLGYFDD